MSDSELFEELERELEEENAKYREERIQHLKQSRQVLENHAESYKEYIKEEDVVHLSAKSNKCVIHFFMRDFKRCQIMDTHLSELATRHPECIFIKVEVSNCPFLVGKLNIKVLPCVIGFAKGLSMFKLVGFDGLPGGDNFTTRSLETLLAECEVINKQGDTGRKNVTLTQGNKDDDDDLDWD